MSSDSPLLTKNELHPVYNRPVFLLQRFSKIHGLWMSTATVVEAMWYHTVSKAKVRMYPYRVDSSRDSFSAALLTRMKMVKGTSPVLGRGESSNPISLFDIPRAMK